MVLTRGLFADARDWISIFTHLVQGGLWAYLYKILDRRTVTGMP